MVNLDGHAAGNGGYRQGEPTVLFDSSLLGRKPWWDCAPVLQSKEQERKPLTYSVARPISIPMGQVTDVGIESTGNRMSSIS